MPAAPRGSLSNRLGLIAVLFVLLSAALLVSAPKGANSPGAGFWIFFALVLSVVLVAVIPTIRKRVR